MSHVRKLARMFRILLPIGMLAVLVIGYGAYRYINQYAGPIALSSNATTTIPVATSCEWATTTPPNNFPADWISSVVAAQYFSQFPDVKYVPREKIDKDTFVMLPKSFTIVEPAATYQGELYMPDGTAIKLADGYYARDKYHVYAGGKVLAGADPASFSIVTDPDGFAKDRSQVWAQEGIIISEADPCSFVVLDRYWSKDASHVYYNYWPGKKEVSVTDADPATFTLIRPAKFIGVDGYAKDKNHVYNSRADGAIISDQPADFILLDDHFAKDNTNVFFDGNKISGADAATFARAGRSEYYKDAHYLYYAAGGWEGGYKLKRFAPANIDTLTFEPIYGEYFKDKDAVYVGGYYDEFTKITGSDPDSFQIMDGNCGSVEKSSASYAKDKNQVYCGTYAIIGADSNTFEYVGEYDDNPNGMRLTSGVAKDKNCVFRRHKKVLTVSGGCVSPLACTTASLAQNPVTCGIYGGIGEFD